MTASVAIDGYVIDVLMRDLVAHDRKPAAYLVYLAVLAGTEAGRMSPSYRELAEQTGLSKRSVQDAVRHLANRGLLDIERRGRTEAATLTPLKPWRRGT